MHQPDHHRAAAADDAASDEAAAADDAVPAYGAPVDYRGSLTTHHGRPWTFAGICDLYCELPDCGDDQPRYTLAGPVGRDGNRRLLLHVRRGSFTALPAGAAPAVGAVLDDEAIELLNQPSEDELLGAGPVPATGGGVELGIALDELPF
ncbi:hypothetical protein [uncultured Pseudonocardia sp.]|jgi:hypothetical protein|uniref:hypothetical protein n=1 Tax=uncultured Pseudonocardia sp. TaxID=211455 RepID=UPI0026388D23|nr:hypothetical protein [uncultured Pseudonocardia sp.]